MIAFLLFASLVFQCVASSNGKHLQPRTDFLEKHRGQVSSQSLAQAKVDSLKVLQGNPVTLSFSSNPPPDSWEYSSTASGRATLSATCTASLSGGSGTPTGSVQFSVWFNGTTVKTTTVNLKNGVASFSYSFGQGPNIVYVTYSGDSNYASYTSNGNPLFAQTYTFSQTYSTGNLKCYEIPGMLYGVHMTNYQYVPGLCDSTKYPVTDCWYSWQQAADGSWLYVYRHWNANTTCPESGCCCSNPSITVPTQNGNPVYGGCYTGYTTTYGYTCAAEYPGWGGGGSPFWVDMCAEPTTPYAPLDAWSSMVR